MTQMHPDETQFLTQLYESAKVGAGYWGLKAAEDIGYGMDWTMLNAFADWLQDREDIRCEGFTVMARLHYRAWIHTEKGGWDVVSFKMARELKEPSILPYSWGRHFLGMEGVTERQPAQIKMHRNYEWSGATEYESWCNAMSAAAYAWVKTNEIERDEVFGINKAIL